MSSWLQRHRKQQLLELSSEAGLELDEDTRKDDIVVTLDNFLQQNATRLSNNSTFEQYYGVRRTPFKSRSSGAEVTADESGEVKSVVKGRGRRTTRVKQEFDDDAGHETAGATSSPTAVAGPSTSPSTTTALARRTPGRPRRSTAANSPTLPASPADVADLAEYESTALYAGLLDAYSLTGLPELLNQIRETCSSLIGVQSAVQLLEAFALQRAVLPWEFLTEVSAVRGFGGPRFSIYYPDLFVLLTGAFWGPVVTYTLTAILLPALVAYFFNLTIREVKRQGIRVSVARYSVDPFVFNIIKAILTKGVYDLGYGSRVLGEDNVAVVREAAYGGYQGILVGCFVVAGASLYEAAQRHV